MSIDNWSTAITETTRLTSPGILGFYDQFEATEIFAVPPGKSDPVNVFTILVAEDRLDAPQETMRYLSPKLFKLKSLKDWKFGIAQYTKPIANLIQALESLHKTGKWEASGKPLQVDTLEPIPMQFAPPDSINRIPWNRVLKNNFWNGSHLLELFDHKKPVLQSLFDIPRRLQELSEAVQQFVPIGLASLSDRLGNIAVQLPVTVMIAKFTSVLSSNDFCVKLAWHPKATARSLRATCEIQFDGVISGFMSSSLEAPETILKMQPKQGVHSGIIWDDQNQIVLASTGPSAFIKTFAIDINRLAPEPRVFTVMDNSGKLQQQRISLVNKSTSIIGTREDDSNWIRKRMYTNEASRLATERRFVQYKPQQRQNALDDIRYLINKYGKSDAWLWDPYLSAQDILETLFHCTYNGANLRALTSCEEYNPPEPSKKKLNFVKKQRKELGLAKGNMYGLRLEYRAKTGKAGWGFHDRFLIFPKAEHGALAWSLGTSVNSLGAQHHILQQVGDGQLIVDAFNELWDLLNLPEHLIWKAP